MDVFNGVFGFYRGTYQPYCRYLPEDSLLEFLEVTEESTIQGLLCSTEVPFPHCLGIINFMGQFIFMFLWILISVCEKHAAEVNRAISSYHAVRMCV